MINITTFCRRRKGSSSSEKADLWVQSASCTWAEKAVCCYTRKACVRKWVEFCSSWLVQLRLYKLFVHTFSFNWCHSVILSFFVFSTFNRRRAVWMGEEIGTSARNYLQKKNAVHDIKRTTYVSDSSLCFYSFPDTLMKSWAFHDAFPCLNFSCRSKENEEEKAAIIWLADCSSEGRWNLRRGTSVSKQYLFCVSVLL